MACDDIDECATDDGGCDQTCTNSEGDYECPCNSGFTLNANEMACDDIDEFATDNGGCDQTYTKTDGDYECSCNSRFTLNADEMACNDIDECVIGCFFTSALRALRGLC